MADNPISSEMDYTEQDTLEPSLAIKETSTANAPDLVVEIPASGSSMSSKRSLVSISKDLQHLRIGDTVV